MESESADHQQVHVLSIQSHVVSGYVGNTAAVFPLQLLGFDVHVINSVQFSNHTGYPVVKGTVMNGTELDALVDGLISNDLCHFDYLLTGYIGSETFLNSILRVLDSCRRINPDIKYVCDPVLGDNNKLYVPLPLIDIFKSALLPRAFMITPNQLEAEYLSGIKITSERHVVECMRKLYDMGPSVVVLTSCEIEEHPNLLCCYVLSESKDVGNVKGDGATSAFSLSEAEGSDSAMQMTRVVVEKQCDFHYTGTGDVTCALLLAWVHKLSAGMGGVPSSSSASEVCMHPCGHALRYSISTIQSVLLRAQQNAVKRAAVMKSRNALSKAKGQDTESATAAAGALQAIKCKLVELPIIQCKRDIEDPVPIHLDKCTTWLLNTSI